MRVAIIADSHFDLESRFEETCRIHRWIARDLAARKVDLVLHSGDLLEGLLHRSTPAARNELASWVQDVTEVAPFVVVRGNHDNLGDLLYLEELNTKHAVIVEEGARCYLVAGAMVACLAWPRKAELLAAAGIPSHEDGEQAARAALQAVLRGFGTTLAKHDGPRIVLSHAMMRGSETSQGQPLVGCDMEVGLEDLALAGADLYALGHIHKGQDWSINDAPVIYPGSPRRTSFGETEAKGYVVATIEGHRVSYERIETPATPMVLLTGDFDATEGLRIEWDDVAGAEVRVRYLVDRDRREAAREQARQLEEQLRAEGAVHVVIEERVRETSKARAPEVSTARGVADQLRAFWRSRDAEPDADVAAQLLERAIQLEDAVGGSEIRCSGHGGMRLASVRLRGVLGFPDEVTLDFEALGDARVVALCGLNGAGKTRLITAWPASIWRKIPRVANLADIATRRDSVIESTFVNGARYTITQTIDAVSRKGETLIVDEKGCPVLDTAGVSIADRWIEEHFLSPAVFYATQFGAQGGWIPRPDGGWKRGGFMDLTEAERKAVVLRAKGIDHIEDMAKLANARVASAREAAASVWARLEEERRRVGDQGALDRELAGARGTAAAKDQDVDRDRLALADAEAAARDAAELVRDHERKRLEAAELRTRAADAEAKAIAERAKVGELEERIRNNEGVLARTVEIRKAVDRDAAITSELATLDRSAADVRTRLAEPTLRLAQAGQDVAKARADLAAAQGAVSRLEAVLAAEAGVTAAVAELPGAKARVASLEADLAQAEADLEDARGKTIAGAEQRIDGLRGGLTLIVQGDQTPAATADRALHADDAAVKAASEVPAEVQRLTDQRRKLAGDLGTARDVVTTYERTASRAGEMERARADLVNARAELESAERAVPAAEAVRTAVQAAIAGIEKEGAALAEQRAKLTAEQASLGDLVAMAARLAQAETRLEELRPQLAAVRSAVEALAGDAKALQERATAADPGPAPAAPDLDAARARVTTATKAAQDAHAAVALVEQKIAASAAAAERVTQLEGEAKPASDNLAHWTRLAADLGRDGLQAVIIGNAIPEFADDMNDLLHHCFGSRWSVSVNTTRTGSDGRELECFEVKVLDTATNTERLDFCFSGGEGAIIGEAESLALVMMACRTAGLDRPTIVRDETPGLDRDAGPAYVRMLGRFQRRTGADRVIFVAHNEQMHALADVRIHVGAGKVAVR